MRDEIGGVGVGSLAGCADSDRLDLPEVLVGGAVLGRAGRDIRWTAGMGFPTDEVEEAGLGEQSSSILIPLIAVLAYVPWRGNGER